MKILLISDIHANLDGLNAVLDAEISKCRGVICLGDITGYGPDPEECVRLVRDLPSIFETCVVLGGNHDAVLSGKLPLEWFNGHAQSSVAFTSRALSPESLEWLSALASTASFSPGVFASHGSPLEPLTGYLWGTEETSAAFSWLAERDLSLSFCGHTHEAAVFSKTSKNRIRYPEPGEVICVGGDRADSVGSCAPQIINPGSTGFPRSFNDMRTADIPVDTLPVSKSSFPAYYAVWDTMENTVTFRAARYDRRAVEDRIDAKM